MKDPALIQESEYIFPYHHLVSFNTYANSRSLYWGIEYYGYIQSVIDEVEKLHVEKILDLGCGEGKLLIELRRRLNDVCLTGIDTSERAITYAKGFGYGQRIEFKNIEVENLDEKFDLIILTEVLEHIPDQQIEKLAWELNAHLNKNGHVLITVPTTVVPLISKHLRHYTVQTLEQQLKPLSLLSAKYLIKNGWEYNLILKITNKFDKFKILRKLSFSWAKSRIFQANKTNGRHLLCIFKKI